MRVTVSCFLVQRAASTYISDLRPMWVSGNKEGADGKPGRTEDKVLPIYHLALRPNSISVTEFSSIANI